MAPRGIINQELITLSTSIKPGKGEPLDKFMKRITHLQLNEKCIAKIEGLEVCPKLQVLYLYGNDIEEIENLDMCINLTHLHLHHNRLTHMGGLLSLSKLTKLYLDGNSIDMVAGLEACQQLQELHISGQKLEEGDGLQFDDSSLDSISGSLQVLVANQVGLREGEGGLSSLVRLRNLTRLDIANNPIDDIGAVVRVCGALSGLASLDLTGCPCSLRRHFFNRVVAASGRRFASLNKREVSPKQRQMVMSLQQHQRQRAELAAVSRKAKQDMRGGGG